MAILNTDVPLVVRMKEYSQEKCEKAATTCLKGRPFKEIKYFDQAMALTLSTPLGLSSFPEVCSFDQPPLPVSNGPPASGVETRNAAKLIPAASSSAQMSPPTVEAVTDNLERLVFQDGENTVQGIINKSEISYNFLGYIGGANGFSNFLFDSSHLNILSKFGKPLFASTDPLSSDVISILTDGATPRVGSLAKNGQQALLRLLGIAPDPQYEWREQGVFDGAWFLTHLYRNGQMERTIAWINLSRVGDWTLNKSGAGNSIVPAACLAAGIASHLGMQNIASLRPDKIIQPAEDGSARLVVRFDFIDAMNNLYGAGVANGMSRSEFRRRVIDFLNIKRKNLLEKR